MKFDAAKIAAVGWSFDSDVPTSGVLRVSCTAGSGKVVASGLSGEWHGNNRLVVSWEKCLCATWICGGAPCFDRERSLRNNGF